MAFLVVLELLNFIGGQQKQNIQFALMGLNHTNIIRFATSVRLEMNKSNNLNSNMDFVIVILNTTTMAAANSTRKNGTSISASPVRHTQIPTEDVSCNYLAY